MLNINSPSFAVAQESFLDRLRKERADPSNLTKADENYDPIAMMRNHTAGGDSSSQLEVRTSPVAKRQSKSESSGVVDFTTEQDDGAPRAKAPAKRKTYDSSSDDESAKIKQAKMKKTDSPKKAKSTSTGGEAPKNGSKAFSDKPSKLGVVDFTDKDDVVQTNPQSIKRRVYDSSSDEEGDDGSTQ